jgi:hypothetical protein
MKSHRVSVTVGEKSIQVTPDPLVMTALDEVRWSGMNAQKFSIEFDGDGPFASRKLGHSDATAGQRPRMKGRFKYTVVSQDNPSLRLDPIIIVEEPPTGSTPP